MPVPVTQYVLKVHSRCDLACDHCYVYRHADQGWRGRPPVISPAAADHAALRIAEHAAAHRLPQVQIVLHGGEPLLVGKERMRGLLATLDSRISPVAALDLRIHTNGVRLDPGWCALFSEYGVRVGISLDGDRAANDRHRLFANGRSSYARVQAALRLLRSPQYRRLYAGILCTIDVRNDPVAVYEALVAEEPPALDLLLPHATWDSPPLRPAGQQAPYADWLTRIYRRWLSDGRPVPIRLFDSLISAAGGGPSWSEAVGPDPVDLLVVETDGSWEQPDSLKTAYDGAAATGADVFTHPVDQVIRQPGFAVRTGGVAALPAGCRACPVVRICGGGLYAHRYRAGTGFDNPSVYCADLQALIGEVTADLPRQAGQLTSHGQHELPPAALDALSAGPGDAAAIGLLAAARLSLTRALAASVAAGSHRWRDPELQKVAAEGWDLLCGLDAAAPAAVREIMAHSCTQTWALRCLRPVPGADADLDRAHLASLAAAAALRAGATVALRVPVRDGTVHLPTLGTLRLDGCPERTALLRISPQRLSAGCADGSWRTIRRLTGPHLQVALDDLDPFRDDHECPAAGPLSAAQWLAWRRGLAAAGARLAAALPGYADALAAGLRTVVPLRRGGHRCEAAQQPFGTVGLAFPHDPQALDALLLHQYQHAKLDAVLRLRPLLRPAPLPPLRVPWLQRPQRPEAVLHEAYAHLALAHLAQAGGPPSRRAHLRHQARVRAAGAALLAAGPLSGDGERFVAGMLAAAG